jgi:uncharacterized membrane protein YozB (DUF420 family)
MDYALLPHLNAGLNGLCACLLLLGFYFIRNNRIQAHRLTMGSAFVVSMAFLVSYLIYHAHAGSVRYQGQGWIRTFYFSILISHTILAALIVPLVLRTLYLALQGRFQDHCRWARWTFPLWLYVSTTGVVIYLMLYQSHVFSL